MDTSRHRIWLTRFERIMCSNIMFARLLFAIRRVVLTRTYVLGLVITPAFVSCSNSSDNADRPPSERTGSIAQSLTDADADGMDDDWEIDHFGTLAQTAAGDFDADGMKNGEEFTYGFNPTVADAFDDADGDRYPNIFELRSSSDPTDAGSLPALTFIVNGAGGGTHTTMSAAISAAAGQSNDYPIIGIAPGTYTGSGNLNINISSSKKLLVIGLEGAAKTIFDNGSGWSIYSSIVVSSLTFRRMSSWALWASLSGEARFVDLRMADSTGGSTYAMGVHVASASKTYVVGSTFMNPSSYGQIYIGGGTATILNTVVVGESARSDHALLFKASGATLATHYCLVKGQTLSGTGNLTGTTDPKLGVDGHLFWDSPLRGAGGGAPDGSIPQSRIDLEGELHPASAPDIGVDQFNDTDADELPDGWELEHAGNLTTLTGRSQDADNDGLSNELEYANGTEPTVADTDGDGLSDGDEVNVYGTNPLTNDTDSDEMPDAWEVAHGLQPLTADAFDDLDGDRFPNVFEYAYATDPDDLESRPTPTIVVSSSGGTHTTVSAAVSAANAESGTYRIIGIAPGTYTGSGNLNINISSSKKLLIIGLEGAAKTIFENGSGWDIYSSAVISSLTFRRMSSWALWASLSGEVRFVDLRIMESTGGTTYAMGVHVASASKTYVVGSTFMNPSSYGQIYIGGGAATILNTVVVGESARDDHSLLFKASSATLTTHHCLVKGQSLSGTGNLPGTTDPKLRLDGHLLPDSPLRSAGGVFSQSRVDMDGEFRPSSAPDIGADQFVDIDADGLPDWWEVAQFGNTSAGASTDDDADGLTNGEEYVFETSPLNADTDGDGLSDSEEVNVHGTSPLLSDTDGDELPDAWEVAHGLQPLTADAFEDFDGDRYPNIFEFAYGTDPSERASTPTPTIVVSSSGGGTHTTVSAGVGAANAESGAYRIVGIAPGTYTGAGNPDIDISSSKKLLIIGLEGAAKTIFEDGFDWDIYSSTVISSLTFRRMSSWVFYASLSGEVRFATSEWSRAEVARRTRWESTWPPLQRPMWLVPRS